MVLDSTVSLVTPPIVYLAPGGALSYTQAHSAYIPPGSTITGFSREQGPETDAPIYLYSEVSHREVLISPLDGFPPSRLLHTPENMGLTLALSGNY